MHRLGGIEEFSKNVIKFAHDVPMAALALRLTPKLIHPLIVPFVTFPNRWHYWKSAKYAIPVIQDRIDKIAEKESNPKSTYEEPNDFITWTVHASKTMGDSNDRTAEMIWTRLIAVGFVSLHTTAFTMTNVLLDLAASPPERGYIEGIREEAERILAEEGGHWTKAGLAKMIRTDSAIRESMRVSGILSFGPSRQVVAEEGLTMPDGSHLRKGANVGIASYFVRHDEKHFKNADQYDAFRFSREREETNGPTEKGRAEVLKNKNLSLVTTSETFLQFGYGRHSCPGRFFAAAELKLIVAHMVMNYDIKPLVERPKGKWFGDTILPPLKATVEIKRRK